MGLFTDIYNTVAKFFRQSDEPVAGDASKAVATNRLKLVLMQDRTNLTPKVLEQMRGELVDLLSKYLEMDKDLLELNFEQEGDQVALMLSIPVIRAKDEEEIEEALKAKAEETSEENEETEDNSEDSDETEECDESEEVCETEEGVNEVEAGEEASKPKRRRSKKVTPPEEMSGEPQEVVEEQQEVVCENHEG